MRLFKENLLFQFSTVSFLIMAVLAVVIATVLTTKLGQNVEHLREHGAAMMAGGMIDPAERYSVPSMARNVRDLQWITVSAVGAGFVALYVSLFTIVWRGWSTINRQRRALVSANKELQEVNAELKEAQERLVRSERLAAIGQLSAGVAHELRNPLGGIKNAAYYIRGKVQDSVVVQENPRVVQFLDIMDEEIASSNQIITDLMDFARVNPPQLTPTKMEELVDKAISRMEIRENVKVEKRFAPDLPEVDADEEQLRRAIANLIKNADDAMPEGGNITISAAAPNGVVELQIHDTGEGIDEQNVAKVFDPLFTTKTKGIGLGLPIVGEVVRKHKGTIEVASRRGEGTTFTIKLPKHEQDEVSGAGEGVTQNGQ